MTRGLFDYVVCTLDPDIPRNVDVDVDPSGWAWEDLKRDLRIAVGEVQGGQRVTRVTREGRDGFLKEWVLPWRKSDCALTVVCCNQPVASVWPTSKGLLYLADLVESKDSWPPGRAPERGDGEPPALPVVRVRAFLTREPLLPLRAKCHRRGDHGAFILKRELVLTASLDAKRRRLAIDDLATLGR